MSRTIQQADERPPTSRSEWGADLRELRHHLRGISPMISLCKAAPPLLAELRLWLMNADYPVGRLPGDSMRALLDEPVYWAFCWGSGAVLARWLLDHPEVVRGRTALDFGAGSGVAAIAAARSGARRAVASDRDPRALAASRANAALNGVIIETCDDAFTVPGEIDVLLAADILYDADNLPLLDRFRARARVVLVADCRLPRLDAPGYEKVWEQECRVAPDLFEAESIRRVNVYRAEGHG